MVWRAGWETWSAVAPVQRVPLEALSADDTAKLVNLWPGAAGVATDVSRLDLDAGGHPLLLTERLRYLLEGGVVDQVAPGIHQSLHARVMRFSQVARDLAAAAATLGRPVSFEMLCQVADLGERDAQSGLAEPLGADRGGFS